jgi:hypothetical protein
MMGMKEVAYWISYFVSDGIFMGFLMAFTATIISSGGLFNGANFGQILGLLLVFCLSVVPFCFFLCSFFDTPQSAGQGALGILIGISRKLTLTIMSITNFDHIYFYIICYRLLCCLCHCLLDKESKYSFRKCTSNLLFISTNRFTNWFWKFLKIT